MGAVAVIVAAGLLGPLLAVWKRFPLPVVVGEIVAGIIAILLIIDRNCP